jgi:hypothetical protein
MLDEGPRSTPIEPSSPAPIDPVFPDSRGTLPADDDAPNEVATPTIQPTMTGSSGPAPASTTALIAADMSDAWTRLDQPARLLFSASVAALVIVLIGLPLSVWDSAPFALLVLVGSTITAVTAWFGASSVFREFPVPRATLELVASVVVAILALLKVIEILFDLDTDGIVSLVVGVALLAAASLALMAARQRGADPFAFMGGDQGAKIAAIGLALVVVGWALNLSISFWTMGQAAVSLAILTIAALTVVEAPRIASPIPVAWVGAGIGAFGALLALTQWADLTSLGRTGSVLDPGDFVGLLVDSVGCALIIAGGALSGRAEWVASHPTGSGPLAEG